MNRFYETHLESVYWLSVRQKVCERSGGMCERCQCRPISGVHHLTYERLGKEDLSDVSGLCLGCHEFVHGIRNEDPMTLALPRTKSVPVVEGMQPIDCIINDGEIYVLFDSVVRTLGLEPKKQWQEVEKRRTVRRTVKSIQSIHGCTTGSHRYIREDGVLLYLVTIADSEVSPVIRPQIAAFQDRVLKVLRDAFLGPQDEPVTLPAPSETSKELMHMMQLLAKRTEEEIPRQIQAVDDRLTENLDDIGQRLNTIQANQHHADNYVTIKGYFNIVGSRCPDRSSCGSLGTKASKLCRARGIERGRAPDETWGRVWTYPKDILDEVVADWQRHNAD